MSRRTTLFKRKIQQAKRAGIEIACIIPTRKVMSTGRTTICVMHEVTDEDGNTTSVLKRFKGQKGSGPCSLPMLQPKVDRILALAK